MMEPLISIIVPTLNEEKHIEYCLRSLEVQTYENFESIIVDGGSTDRTVEIARDYQAKVVVEKGCPEFPSRNIGANVARGGILLFICADVVLPRDLLEKIRRRFEENQELLSLTGPDIPLNSLFAEIEYRLYNSIRYFFSLLPRPLKRFSTSTNFLAIRKGYFDRIGGFVSDINADGIMGRQLSELGQVEFCPDTYVFISSRRFEKMGFLKFNSHYSYILENFFPLISRAKVMRILKSKASIAHSQLHENS